MAEIGMRRFFYWLQYRLGRVPWDTNVTPPELARVIEGEGLAPGHALDIGCGTGTNAIYMAQHGWKVTGVDFVRHAIRQARRKAQRAGVGDSVRFVRDSVTNLRELGLAGISLALDIGCLHSLSPVQRAAYAEGLGAVTRAGAVYLLYAFLPRAESGGWLGMAEDEVARLFAPQFEVVTVARGQNTSGEAAPSAWYRLQRPA